jgi:hypothetical protein
VNAERATEVVLNVVVAEVVDRQAVVSIIVVCNVPVAIPASVHNATEVHVVEATSAPVAVDVVHAIRIDASPVINAQIALAFVRIVIERVYLAIVDVAVAVITIRARIVANAERATEVVLNVFVAEVVDRQAIVLVAVVCIVQVLTSAHNVTEVHVVEVTSAPVAVDVVHADGVTPDAANAINNDNV